VAVNLSLRRRVEFIHNDNLKCFIFHYRGEWRSLSTCTNSRPTSSPSSHSNPSMCFLWNYAHKVEIMRSVRSTSKTPKFPKDVHWVFALNVDVKSVWNTETSGHNESKHVGATQTSFRNLQSCLKNSLVTVDQMRKGCSRNYNT